MFLGHSGGLDTDGNELPRLIYVSREKRPGFQHHKKAGAMNALVCSLVQCLGSFLLHILSSCSLLIQLLFTLTDPCFCCSDQWSLSFERGL